jgi:uncharacterized iron-regulated membrane protein
MSAKINKKVFAIHQWLGLYSGIILLVLSITGAAIVFASELDSSLNKNVMVVTPQANRISVDAILADVRKRYPNSQLNKLELQNEYPSRALYAELEGKNKVKQQVFYNQYTGVFLGERQKEMSFTHYLVALHTRLLAGSFGKIIVGLMGLGLFITGITGTYFYRKSLFSVFRIGVRWDKNWKTISSDAHKLVGVSTLAFTLMFGFTGFYMHRNEFIPGGKEKEEKKMAGKQVTASAIAISIDDLLQSHSQDVAGFVPAIVDFPKKQSPYYKIKGNTPSSSRLTGGKHDTEIVLAANDLSLLGINSPTNTPGIKKFNRIMSELHYGQYGGLGVKLLYCMMGICTALLSITGFVIWYKKKYKKSGVAKKAPKQGSSLTPQPVIAIN